MVGSHYPPIVMSEFVAGQTFLASLSRCVLIGIHHWSLLVYYIGVVVDLPLSCRHFLRQTVVVGIELVPPSSRHELAHYPMSGCPYIASGFLLGLGEVS